ncbi:MAG: hypothetical protein GYA17_09515 [Chloroflexi bacterium]|jgi:hypothetical protein|nr:hypothetical protein [Chloroflexota bacterium]
MSSSPPQLRLRDLLFTPLGCLLQSSPVVLLVVLLGGYIAGEYVYYNVNTSLWGLFAHPLEAIQADATYEHVQEAGVGSWNVVYESPTEVEFRGLVRHVSPVRMELVPFLTHDVLVTSGDFTDPGRVQVIVAEHQFAWAAGESNPQGEIHLLHIVPANAEVYRRLLSVRRGQTLSFRGREILRIDALDPAGQSLGWWQDDGCNSILVTAVNE